MKFGREQERVITDTEVGRLEQVEELKYLGVNFTQKGDTLYAIQERIKMGYTTRNRLLHMWKGNIINKPLKMRLCNVIVFPTVLYGAESWILK